MGKDTHCFFRVNVHVITGKMTKLLKAIFIFIMWYPFRMIVGYLPLSWVLAAGRAGGYLLYCISDEKRKLMRQELHTVFPGKSGKTVRKIVREAFVNYCISEIEILLYPVMTPSLMQKLVTIEGLVHLDEALARGRGVLLFQAHFGAFQMVMPAIGYSGYTMNQISASASVWQAEDAPEIVKRSLALKSRYEYTLPVRHMSVAANLRPVFRALKRNEIVGITVDGGGGRKTVQTEFLGRHANFQKGAIDLALRTGAEIVPAFIVSEKGLRHTLHVHPALEIKPLSDREACIRETLDRFISILTSYIMTHPDHYGYTLYLRRSRAVLDHYPFFDDYPEHDRETVK